MSGNVKTALIVVGAAVGGFVLLKMLAPSQSPAAKLGKTPSNTAPLSINGLIGLGSAALSLFGSSGGSSTPTGYTASPSPGNSVGYDQGESFDDFTAGMFGPGIPTYD